MTVGACACVVFPGDWYTTYYTIKKNVFPYLDRTEFKRLKRKVMAYILLSKMTDNVLGWLKECDWVTCDLLEGHYFICQSVSRDC